MRLEKAKSIKAEILRNLREDDHSVDFLPKSFEDEFATFRSKKHRKMLAVGYARHDENEYSLELRVRANKGVAFDLATRIRDELNSEEGANFKQANVALLQSIKVVGPETLDDGEFASDLRKRKIPLQLGSSIGNVEGKSGTLGGFLIDDGEEDQERYILSCNHVLALCDQSRAGDSIVHPGPDDSDPIVRNHVGWLSEYVANLISARPNGSDSALAKLDTADRVSILGNVVPPGLSNSGAHIAPLTEDYPLRGAVVEKIGRSTGHTKGTIATVSLDNVDVEYRFIADGKAETKVFTFDNVIEILSGDRQSPFSFYGDSGSLVYTEIDSKLFGVGIVFAGAFRSPENGGPVEPLTLCCTLKDILQKYPELRWMEAGQ